MLCPAQTATRHRTTESPILAPARSHSPSFIRFSVCRLNDGRSLLEGQYENPVRIVAFNTAEGWSRDVTFDIADELRRRYIEYDEVPVSVLRFLETAIRH
jgi:hypothetical protein